MWDPDLNQLPDDHDPWPWRIGVLVWGIGIVAGPFLMDGVLAIVLSGFIALIVGVIVRDHRKRRRDTSRSRKTGNQTKPDTDDRS